MMYRYRISCTPERIRKKSQWLSSCKRDPHPFTPISNMASTKQSQVVARFCKGAATINGFKHVRSKSWLTRLLGPDAWYVAKFEDPKTGIKSTYSRWANTLAVDGYLNSILIEYQGRVVYRADINRYNVDDQINQQFDSDPEWLNVLQSIAERYVHA